MKVYNLWERITWSAYFLGWIVLYTVTLFFEMYFIPTLHRHTDLTKGPLELLLYFGLVLFNALVYSKLYLGFSIFRAWAKNVNIEVPENINWIPIKFRKV